MATPAIASGAVVVTANADKMVSGLKQAKQKSESMFKDFHKDLGKDFAQEMGKTTFAGGVLGGLAGGGIGGGLSELIANGATMFKDFVLEADKFAESMKEVQKDSSLAAKEMAAAFGRRDLFLAIPADREGKLAKLNDEVKLLKERKDRQNEFVDGLKEELEAMKNLRDPTTWVGRARGEVGIKEAEIAGAEEALAGISERLAKIMGDRDKLGVRSKDDVFVAKIEQLTHALKIEADTWGMTAEQIQRHMLVIDGATDHMLRDYDEQAAALARLKELGKDPPPWMSMMLGMAGAAASEQTIPPWMAMALGVAGSASQLKFPEAKPQQLDNLAGAVEAGTMEGYSLSVQNRFGGPDKVEETNRANGAKIDAVKDAINAGFDALRATFNGLGVV